MFHALLLVHNDSACTALENLALESKQVSIQKTLYRSPGGYELRQILNMQTPDLVLLDLSQWDESATLAADIHTLAPLTAIIGFGAGWDPMIAEQSAAAGITELLVSPVTVKGFQDCVERAIHKVRGVVQENLFAFLPAKAGSGCTTIALNTAGYLARSWGANPGGGKVLLIDADLNSGVIAELLGCEHPYSLVDALNNSGQLDYSSWEKYVAKPLGLDVLLSNRSRKSPLPSWSSYHHLLEFAASRYGTILVDLPEVVNDATVEVVRRAKRVFVVTTPEPLPLSLTPQRCEELIRRGIPEQKIGVILNRWHKGDITASEVEASLKNPVSAVFGNDYAAIRKAAAEHEFVHRDTKVGKSFASFASTLAGVAPNPSGLLGFLKGLGAKATPQPGA